MTNGSEFKGRSAKALRAAGYYPLPRLWVTGDDLDKIMAMAVRHQDDVNRIRVRANQIGDDMDRAWAQHNATGDRS